MKSVDYLNSKVLYILFIYFFLSSCDDQNFDWDAVHNQGNESLYESLFTSLFGGIDPDQSWDFSEGTKLESTRAANSSYYPTISTDYYDVESTTLNWMSSNLPENGDKYCTTNAQGFKVPTSDNSFILYLPETGFKITPIYQGKSGMTWDLYMVVDNDKENPILIWSKSSVKDSGKTYPTNTGIDNFQVKVGCTDCNGTGYKCAKCTKCGGTGGNEYLQATNAYNKYYKIYSHPDHYYYSYYLYNADSNFTDLRNDEADVYIFIKLSNYTYLYNVSQGFYLNYNGSALTSSSTPIGISTVSYSNNRLCFNYGNTNYYACIQGTTLTFSTNQNASGSSSWKLYDVTNTNQVSQNNKNNANTAISAASQKIRSCTSCGGTGYTQSTCQTCNETGVSSKKGNTWVSVYSLGNNQAYPESARKTIGAAAVRSKSLVWGDETQSPLPAIKLLISTFKSQGMSTLGGGIMRHIMHQSVENSLLLIIRW